MSLVFGVHSFKMCLKNDTKIHRKKEKAERAFFTERAYCVLVIFASNDGELTSTFFCPPPPLG